MTSNFNSFYANKCVGISDAQTKFLQENRYKSSFVDEYLEKKIKEISLLSEERKNEILQKQKAA